MPARIRLQVKGCMSNRFYWLIAHSSKSNPRSRPIERLGYWIPDSKQTYENRSIIINRPRLKYWIGIGAQPTVGVFKLLSKIGFLPKKPPPFGTHTLYPIPEKSQKILPPQQKDLGAVNHLRDLVEEMEKKKQRTKESYLENAKMQFHFRPTEELEEDSKDFMNKYSEYMEKIASIIPNNADGRMEIFLKLLKIFKESDVEITSNVLSDEMGLDMQSAEEVINSYKLSIGKFDVEDLQDFKKDLSSNFFNFKTGIKRGEKFHIPASDPITPVPDFDDDLSNELPLKLFDIKHPLRPNKDYGIKFQNPEVAQNFKKNSGKQILKLTFGKKKKK
jgi:small subunit ribosomal protein S16